MVDSLRHDLIQVVRRCGKTDCIIGQPEINKILNGKFQEVIDDYAKSPKVRTSTINEVVRKADDSIEIVTETPEPVHPQDEDDYGNDQNDEVVEHRPTAIPEREPTANSKFF